MFKEIDERFNLIKLEFQRNDSSTDLIVKAYDLAKLLHKDQRRKDGQMYISHPVEVALMLAKLGFDENVVCAALLHDVVEDCDCSLETIEKEFNKKVVEMVDCVSAIDKTQFVYDEDDVYEDVNFEKASMEEQSFKKLISIGKKNPLGFCIKFADRLHNLRTIATFAHSKQLEKVKETEKWIIPIAKTLNAEYFYRAIKNECFKIKHKFDGKDFFEHYQDYHNSNAINIENLQTSFEKVFSNSPISIIKIKNVKEYKVFEDVQKLMKNINVNKVSQGQILKVANYNVYLLHNSSKRNNDVIGEVLNVLNRRMGEIKIID
ncbi:MAG: HD domain-containing protein, partial [Clostridia bacterium]|nr:HD domain-containing protein [Clostridia bacterium]